MPVIFKYSLTLITAFVIAGFIWWRLDVYLTEKKIQQEDVYEILKQKDLKPGVEVFIRIFKQSSELELWLQDKGRFVHVKTYPICKWSGKLGPKLKEGDKQSPEGFYQVGKSQLNPNSKYHLSFNLGFPNAYDRAHKRTGSFLMVHGACDSIGCYAITDSGIEEVYSLVEAALNHGQAKFSVHIYPFKLTQDNLEKNKGNKWSEFWQSLKPAYDWFEKNKTVPTIIIRDKTYVVG